MSEIGRPRKFTSVEELQTEIQAFFKDCEERSLIPTVTGLAVWLDTTRRTLLDYETEYEPEFSHAIKSAKTMIEMAVEQHLLQSRNATGAIFNLKNNFGWKDQTEQKLDVNAKVSQVELVGLDESSDSPTT